MSITYTPTTNFGSKDSLPSNDPNKVIKGTEFTTEFIAIQTAFGLAAPTSNPTFTGTATFDDISANTISLTDVDVVTLDVTGTATLADADVVTLDVTGTSTLADADVVTLDVTGTSTLADADVTTLDVTGTSTLADADVTTLDVTGTLTASSLLYPTTDGTDGQALLTDGSGTLAFGDVVGGIDYTKETSNYTLEANQGVIADTTGGTFVVTLPLSPAEGDQVVVADGGDWSTINLTVGRNGQTIEGVASDLTMDVGGISVTMVYDGTTWQLYPATGTSAGTTYTLDQTTTAGNITTNDITVGNLTSTGIDDNATSTAITIDADENVGIGTDDPATAGHIKVGTNGDGLTLQRDSVTNGDYSQLSFVNSTTDSFIAPLWIRGYRGSSVNLDYLTFGSGGSEAMRIDADGSVLVGTTLDPDTGGAGVKLENSSSSRVGRITIGSTSAGSSTAISFRNSSSTSGEVVGSIVSSPTVTLYNTSSDVRLKKNVVDAPAGNIDDIKIRSFAWKVDGSQQKYGVVAQELFKVAPEAVFKGETEDDTWGVDYSKLVPMMIKEIQDLKAEVAALKGVN